VGEKAHIDGVLQTTQFGLEFSRERSSEPYGCQVPGALAPTLANGGAHTPAQLAPMTGELSENGRGNLSKMKVHPGILMKTKKGRFQVSGARCQDPHLRCCGERSLDFQPRPRQLRENCTNTGEEMYRKMKVDPGIMMKTNRAGFRCQVSGATSATRGKRDVPIFRRGCGSYGQIERTLARRCIEK